MTKRTDRSGDPDPADEEVDLADGETAPVGEETASVDVSPNSADSSLRPPRPSTISVLLVDDEPGLVDVAAEFLSRRNERFEVTTTMSAEAGLEALERERIDCVVSDYDMPGTNGLEFLRTVRERYGDRPFILFTGRGSEEIASEAITAGVSDYLQKETGTDQYAVLAARIESVVSRASAERRLEEHLDRMTDAFYTLDEEWQFTYLNDRAATMLERDRTELIGEVLWDEFPAATDTRIETEYRRAMRTGEPTTFELRYEPLETDFEMQVYPSETGLSVYARDITERRARERELQELSERFDLALDGAEIGVWDWDLTTDEVTFDERWAEMLGYDLAEIDSDLSAWADRVHPDDLDEVWDALEAHFAGETEHYRCDHRMRTKSGEWKWIRDCGTVVERNDDGEPRRAVGVHIDVTDEKERRRGLDRYRQVLDEMPASVCTYDADRRFTFVNRRLAEKYETTPAELVGTKSPLLEQLARTHEADPFEALVAGDRESFSGTVELEFGDDSELGDGNIQLSAADPDDPDGSRLIDCELTRLVIDGEFDGVLGVFRDVTETKRREERLERATARLNALFEYSPDMIDVHDSEGRILDVNRSMCEALGYDAEELLDRRVWDIDAEMDPDETKRVWEDLDLGETLARDTTYRRKDGSTFPVRVHVRRIDVQGKDRYLVSSRDISEQKAYERQIERENERLEEFASIVSHDLRNPLNVLGGYLELARETGNEAYFDRCTRAVQDMERLIDDLLTLARQGRTVGDPEPVDLDSVIGRCWTNVEGTSRKEPHHDAQSSAESEGPTLSVDIDATVLADEGRLKQLFENLFRNAIEHGGPNVSIAVGELDDGTGLYVADDGPGISEVDRERVFESGHSTSESGTGFGLSIVESIVEAHGWTVRATESETGGARFEIEGVERAAQPLAGDSS